MITKEIINQFNILDIEKTELSQEKSRIEAFLSRPSDNKDTKMATKDNAILVKFAGTACYLPKALFTAELLKRKKTIDDRLQEIEVSISTL